MGGKDTGGKEFWQKVSKTDQQREGLIFRSKDRKSDRQGEEAFWPLCLENVRMICNSMMNWAITNGWLSFLAGKKVFFGRIESSAFILYAQVCFFFLFNLFLILFLFFRRVRVFFFSSQRKLGRDVCWCSDSFLGIFKASCFYIFFDQLPCRKTSSLYLYGHQIDRQTDRPAICSMAHCSVNLRRIPER